MARRMVHKDKKKKLMRYRRIKKGESQLDDSVLAVLQEVRDSVSRHKQVLAEANIGLCFWNNVKADKDGNYPVGKAIKVGEAQHEFMDCDFVIFVNRMAWEIGDAKQRRAMMDHELEHCDRSVDANGEVKTDPKGRTIWRLRRTHDIQEFEGIVKRRGAWSKALQQMIASAAAKGDLFSENMEPDGKKKD